MFLSSLTKSSFHLCACGSPGHFPSISCAVVCVSGGCDKSLSSAIILRYILSVGYEHDGCLHLWDWEDSALIATAKTNTPVCCLSDRVASLPLFPNLVQSGPRTFASGIWCARLDVEWCGVLHDFVWPCVEQCTTFVSPCVGEGTYFMWPCILLSTSFCGLTWSSSRIQCRLVWLHGRQVLGAGFSCDGSHFVTCGIRNVKIWDMGPGGEFSSARVCHPLSIFAPPCCIIWLRDSCPNAFFLSGERERESVCVFVFVFVCLAFP